MRGALAAFAALALASCASTEPRSVTELPGAVALGRQGIVTFPRRAPGAPGLGALPCFAARAAKRVEQAPVSMDVEQAHGLVLAVNLDEQGAEIAQDPDAGRLVVDEGARTTVGIDRAAQDEILVPVVGVTAID